MLISSKEIKTISTINIKLQLSHQAAAGSQPRPRAAAVLMFSLENLPWARTSDQHRLCWWGWPSCIITALYSPWGCCTWALSCSQVMCSLPGHKRAFLSPLALLCPEKHHRSQLTQADLLASTGYFEAFYFPALFSSTGIFFSPFLNTSPLESRMEVVWLWT